MSGPRILVFAGSTRTGALSGKVAALAAKELALADADVTLISLADYDMPIYDGDLEREKGVPGAASRLAKMVAAHHGVYLSTPEYNHSLPPLLKNAIDWVSRIRADSGIDYRGRVTALAGSATGRFGGTRAVMDLREVIATAWGALVIPERFELSYARDAFNEAGDLIDEGGAAALKRQAAAMVAMTRRVADPELVRRLGSRG